MWWTRWAGVVSLLLVAACTSGSGTKAQSSGPASTAAAASAKVSVQGDEAVTRAFGQPDVRCSFPDVDGPSIALLSTSSGLVFRTKVQQGKVAVLVTDSATPTPHERDFSGTGVTTFDPATGAQVDSALTETPTASPMPGDIGRLSAIKASVDCAGQDPGSSTVTLTGDTPRGALSNAALETPRVECNPAGNEVSVVGVVDVGGGKEFIDLGLRPDGVTVNKLVGNGEEYVSPADAATVTDTGAQVNGDAAGQGAAAAHVLHVQGGARCGTPVG
jgi:hypothetical protein